MADNFEDARKETEMMFEQPQEVQEEQVVEEQPTEETPEVPVEEQPTDEQPTQQPIPEQPVEEQPEQPVEQPVQPDAQALQNALLLELQKANEENERLRALNEEMSQRQSESIIEDVIEPPVLDMSNLTFATDDEIQRAQAKYAKDMAAYSRKMIMKDLEPYISQAKDGMREKERREALQQLGMIPDLQDMDSRMPEIERLIKDSKWLDRDDVPIGDKYVAAYFLARGVEAMKNPPQPKSEPSIDELMSMYKSNPALQEAIEKERISQLKDSQQVPPLSSSTGAVNAALNIKEKPKTFDEASERTRKMFGLD